MTQWTRQWQVRDKTIWRGPAKGHVRPQNQKDIKVAGFGHPGSAHAPPAGALFVGENNDTERAVLGASFHFRVGGIENGMSLQYKILEVSRPDPET